VLAHIGIADDQSQTPYPLYCAGVVVGMSRMADVQKMYGDGLFVAEEGHGGGRYFVDPKQEVTLHVESGVDNVIETVSLSRGVRLPDKYKKGTAVPKQAIAPRLSVKEELSWINLGNRADKILDHFGPPKEDKAKQGIRTIIYETDYTKSPYVLAYRAELEFEDDKLVSVTLYNGE